MLVKHLLIIMMLTFLPRVLCAQDGLQPDLLEKKLTNYEWRRSHDQGLYFAEEVTRWRFYKNGAFVSRFTSDYSERYKGAWAIAEALQEGGMLLMASTTSAQMPPPRFHALSFGFHDNGLRLGEEFYQGVPFPTPDVAPPIRIEDHAAVTASERQHFFPLWTVMTTSDWRRNSVSPTGDPSQYSFHKSGTYTAYFATTRCHYSGTWSLFTSGGNTGEIRLSVPANRCDPRGPAETFVRTMPVEFKDNEMHLYQTVYLPLKGGEE
jgi:hypothetical protein